MQLHVQPQKGQLWLDADNEISPVKNSLHDPRNHCDRYLKRFFTREMQNSNSGTELLLLGCMQKNISNQKVYQFILQPLLLATAFRDMFFNYCRYRPLLFPLKIRNSNVWYSHKLTLRPYYYYYLLHVSYDQNKIYSSEPV